MTPSDQAPGALLGPQRNSPAPETKNCLSVLAAPGTTHHWVTRAPGWHLPSSHAYAKQVGHGKPRFGPSHSKLAPYPQAASQPHSSMRLWILHGRRPQIRGLKPRRALAAPTGRDRGILPCRRPSPESCVFGAAPPLRQHRGGPGKGAHALQEPACPTAEDPPSPWEDWGASYLLLSPKSLPIASSRAPGPAGGGTRRRVADGTRCQGPWQPPLGRGPGPTYLQAAGERPGPARAPPGCSGRGAGSSEPEPPSGRGPGTLRPARGGGRRGGEGRGPGPTHRHPGREEAVEPELERGDEERARVEAADPAPLHTGADRDRPSDFGTSQDPTAGGPALQRGDPVCRCAGGGRAKGPGPGRQLSCGAPRETCPAGLVCYSPRAWGLKPASWTWLAPATIWLRAGETWGPPSLRAVACQGLWKYWKPLVRVVDVCPL